MARPHNRSAPTPEVSLLERILRDQLDGHQALLRLIRRKREAVRTADIDCISDICEQEHDLAQRLAELEKDG